MKANDKHGINSVNSSNIYVPIDLDRYCLPPEKKPEWRPTAKNDLVDHVLHSLKENSLNAPPSGGIEEIFEDRLTLIRSKIDMLLVQISQRKSVHQEIMHGIAKDSCRVQNLINERLIGTYSIDRERLNLEKMKFELEQQTRREAAGYFNDTSLLKRELREALIQYQEEVQKNALISDMEVTT